MSYDLLGHSNDPLLSRKTCIFVQIYIVHMLYVCKAIYVKKREMLAQENKDIVQLSHKATNIIRPLSLT